LYKALMGDGCSGGIRPDASGSLDLGSIEGFCIGDLFSVEVELESEEDNSGICLNSLSEGNELSAAGGY